MEQSIIDIYVSFLNGNISYAAEKGSKHSILDTINSLQMINIHEKDILTYLKRIYS